ncbi:2-oxoglutarate dehydrogenase, E2 component, dihydrolipoamide succinyltransferase [soil metagenome]
MADIQMPQLGETVTEGTITKWFKAVGDEIAEDEVLFEVSTDKVDSEVPSPSGGYLAEILVEEGETVDVGTRLAVVTDSPPGEGAGDGSEEAEAAEPEATPSDDEQAREEPKSKAEASAEQAPADDDAAAAEADAAEAETDGEPDRRPQGRAEGATRKGEGAGKGPAPSRPAGRNEGKLLSPVVRRLISEHGLDPDQLEGTGAGGRITRNDVLRAVESDGGGTGGAPAETAPAASEVEPAPSAPARPAQAPAPKAKAGERDTVEPLNNIRKRTGEHMLRSKATAPHVLVASEVDYEAVEVARRAHRQEWKDDEGFSLTYLPFVARAVVDAIAEFPHVNASVGDGELIVHHDVNLGIAVDLDFHGLIVPVIHAADGKRLRAISREVSDLAGRARNKKLSADEISGGTFTITNPGPFGTFLTYPVINQPQVAILSTDGVKRRPVVIELPDGTEGIAIHSVGFLGLSFDHRAFDGAYASAFLAKVREIIETRDWGAEIS